MAKTVTVGLDPGLYGKALWDSMTDDNDSTSGLLWVEIQDICRRAHLDVDDCELITLYYQGWSQQDIATIRKVTQQAVSKRQAIIFGKLAKIKHRGLITAVVESVGWEGLRWVLNGSRNTTN